MGGSYTVLQRMYSTGTVLYCTVILCYTVLHSTVP